MDNRNIKQKRLLFILILLLSIPVIWFFFMNKDNNYEEASKMLTGKWLRNDGVYSIEIKSVNKDGSMKVAYFNPDPIEVGQSTWMFKDKKLHIEVVLLGPYQKSIYKLNYDVNKKNLSGTFYQAVAQQTYNVSFKKVK